MNNSESDMAYLRGEIIDYLRKNPNAGDSLEGVVNWWLPPEYGKVDTVKIEQILEQLISEGLVRKTPLVDGTILYRQVEEQN